MINCRSLIRRRPASSAGPLRGHGGTPDLLGVGSAAEVVAAGGVDQGDAAVWRPEHDGSGLGLSSAPAAMGDRVVLASTERCQIVLAGLAADAGPVGFVVVQVEVASGGAGVGKAAARVLEENPFSHGEWDLVGVGGGELDGEVDDGFDGDVAAAEPVGDDAGQDRADVFDPGDAVAVGEGFSGDVDIQGGVRPEPSRVEMADGVQGLPDQPRIVVAARESTECGSVLFIAGSGGASPSVC